MSKLAKFNILGKTKEIVNRIEQKQYLEKKEVEILCEIRKRFIFEEIYRSILLEAKITSINHLIIPIIPCNTACPESFTFTLTKNASNFYNLFECKKYSDNNFSSGLMRRGREYEKISYISLVLTPDKEIQIVENDERGNLIGIYYNDGSSYEALINLPLLFSEIISREDLKPVAKRLNAFTKLNPGCTFTGIYNNVKHNLKELNKIYDYVENLDESCENFFKVKRNINSLIVNLKDSFKVNYSVANTEFYNIGKDKNNNLGFFLNSIKDYDKYTHDYPVKVLIEGGSNLTFLFSPGELSKEQKLTLVNREETPFLLSFEERLEDSMKNYANSDFNHRKSIIKILDYNLSLSNKDHKAPISFSNIDDLAKKLDENSLMIVKNLFRNELENNTKTFSTSLIRWLKAYNTEADMSLEIMKKNTSELVNCIDSIYQNSDKIKSLLCSIYKNELTLNGL